MSRELSHVRCRDRSKPLRPVFDAPLPRHARVRHHLGNRGDCAWRGLGTECKACHSLAHACVSVDPNLWPRPGAVRARTGQHRWAEAGWSPHEEPAPREHAPREGPLWWSQYCPIRSGCRVRLAAARQGYRAQADFSTGFLSPNCLIPPSTTPPTDGHGTASTWGNDVLRSATPG